MPWQWPWRRPTRDRALWNVGDIQAPPSYAGIPVSPDQAMRLSAVWGCVRLLSDSVSTLPLDVYRRGERAALPALPPLLQSPSADADLGDWLYMVMASLLLRGNAYGIVRARGGAAMLPSQVELAHPDHVSCTLDGERRVVYCLGGEEVPSEDVWHVRAYRLPTAPTGPPVGLSPVEYARQAIGLGLAVERFGAQYFGEGAVPSVVLEVEQQLNREQAENLREVWGHRHTGHHRPAVASGGAKVRPLTIAPEESQFIETTRANVATICRYYGVPPEMVAGESGGSLTYASVEQRALDFLTFSVRPWLVRVERAVSALLPRTQVARFNAGGLVRTSLIDRYTAHKLGIEAGFLRRNEARELEDLPPVPGLDDQPPAPAPGGGIA
jgi:HK97 family phage portal protein